MGWRDLLQPEDERIVVPWVGGRSLHAGGRALTLAGELPAEHGWHAFRLVARKASWLGEAPAEDDALRERVSGYLVGDRLVPDHVRLGTDLRLLVQRCERVHLIEPGLDRFVRLTAGRTWDGGPLVYAGLAFPLGSEDEVLTAFLDGAPDVDHVPAVAPALDAVFRVERWRQAEAERRRREAEERRQREEEERAQRERRNRIRAQLGDGAGRRAVAAFDFEAAARSALAVGGAQLLDVRRSHQRHEMVVRYRFNGRRFECTCHAHTLQIIDAGVCLIDHHTGERGDARFTLESLPAVIGQAEREGVLVVFRHVD